MLDLPSASRPRPGDGVDIMLLHRAHTGRNSGPISQEKKAPEIFEALDD
jgi:hypothetical protein